MTTLRIDIRDRRLRGGRLNIAADTERETVRKKREAAVRTLIDRDDMDAVEALRAGKLHITEVEAAVRRGDFASLNGARQVDTLAVAAEKFLRTVRGTKSKRTHELYTSIVTGLLDHFGGAENLEQVTKEQTEAYLHEARQRGRQSPAQPWSPSHQRQTRLVGVRIWQIGGARKNPWKAATTPRVRNRRHAYLQPAEWRALAETTAGTPMAALLAVGCLAGLRMGEARYLRTDLDVDLAARSIVIQPRKGAHEWTPKTDNSVRKVPIGNELLPILTYHSEHFAGARFFFRLPKRDAPIHPATVRKWTMRAFAAAGLRYGLDDALTFHSMRHTFATWMLLGRPPKVPPVPVHVVAALMGDDVATVLDVYAHLLSPNLLDGVTVLDAVAGGGGTKT